MKTMRTCLRVGLLALLLAAASLHAANYVWDGSTNNWHTAHWGGTAPAAGNTYTLGSGVASNSTTAFAGNDLSVATGGTLRQYDGSPAANGTITFSGGTLETVTLGANRTLTATGGFVVPSGSTSTVAVTPAGLKLTLSGTLAGGAGTLNKTGPGILVFGTTSPAFAGTVNAITGDVQIGQNIPAAFVNVGAGARLYLLPGATASNTNLTLNGGAIYYASGGASTLNGSMLVAADSVITGEVDSARSFGCVVSGSGNLDNQAMSRLKLATGFSSANYTGALQFSVAGGAVDLNAFAASLGGLSSSGGFGDVYNGASSAAALTLQPGAGKSYSYSGQLRNATGALALTLNGQGTQTLAAATAYSGATTISAGTLVYGVDNVFSNGAVTVAGGTLDMGSYTDAVGVVTLSGGRIIGSSASLAATGVALQSGLLNVVLAGTGAVTKTTSGTAILPRANLYAGTTTINGGTLMASNSAALSTNTVVVGAGGVLHVPSGITITNALTLGAGGGLAGAGTLAIASTPTVTLSGANVGRLEPGDYAVGTLTLTNGLTLNSGALLNVEFKADPATGHDQVNVSGGTLTINGGAVNIYTEGGTTRASLPVGTSYNLLLCASIAGTANKLAVANPDPARSYLFDVSGGAVRLNVLGSASRITTADAGNSGWNTAAIWSDSTAPGAGKAYVMLNGASVLATKSTTFGATDSGLQLDAGATLYWGATGTGSGGSITLPGTLTLNGGTVSAPASMNTAASTFTAGSVVLADSTTSTFDLRNASVTATLTGPLAGSGKLVRTGYDSGSGTFTLGTASPGFTGTFELTGSGGTANIDGNCLGNIPSAAAYIKGGGNVNLANVSFTQGNLHLDGGKITTLGGANPILTGPLAIDVNGGEINETDGNTTFTITGFLTGAGTLTKSGNGQVLFSAGASGYSGNLVINAGSLRTDAYGTLTTNTVSVAGRLWASGPGGTPGTIVVGSVSGAGTLELGPNSSGTTVTLATGSDNSSTAFSGLVRNHTDVTQQKGGFLKVGNGTFTLSGNNTYTGGTTINAGTLAVGHANALGPSGTIALNGGKLSVEAGISFSRAFTFAGGAAVGGNGTFAQAVTVPSGGHVAPGSTGVGTLTFSALTNSNGSVFDIEGNVTTNDSIAVTAADALSIGSVAVNLFREGTTNEYTCVGARLFNLVRYSGADPVITGLTVANPVTKYRYTFQLGTVGADKYVQLAIVPPVNGTAVYFR